MVMINYSPHWFRCFIWRTLGWKYGNCVVMWWLLHKKLVPIVYGLKKHSLHRALRILIRKYDFMVKRAQFVEIVLLAFYMRILHVFAPNTLPCKLHSWTNRLAIVCNLVFFSFLGFLASPSPRKKRNNSTPTKKSSASEKKQILQQLVSPALNQLNQGAESIPLSSNSLSVEPSTSSAETSFSKLTSGITVVQYPIDHILRAYVGWIDGERKGHLYFRNVSYGNRITVKLVPGAP